MSMLRSITTFTALFLAISAPAGAATFSLNLQPVTICEAVDPATCQSTLDAVPGAALFDEGLLKAIYGQIGIDLNVLPSMETTSLSLSRNSLNRVEATPALFAFEQHQDLIGLAPNTVYVGFTGTLDTLSVGTAILGQNSIEPKPYAIVTNAVGQSLAGGSGFPDPNKMRFQSVVVAHLMGHVLGARHEDASGFVMSRGALTPPPGIVPPFSAASKRTTLKYLVGILNLHLDRVAALEAVEVERPLQVVGHKLVPHVPLGEDVVGRPPAGPRGKPATKRGRVDDGDRRRERGLACFATPHSHQNPHTARNPGLPPPSPNEAGPDPRLRGGAQTHSTRRHPYPSLSQRSLHHSMVTMLPNHWWVSSWQTT